MKPQNQQNSTQQQISKKVKVVKPFEIDCPFNDIVDYYTTLEAQSIPGKAVFHGPSSDGYPKYLDRENDPYCRLVAPNPPTEEMIKRAQFVDKTYHWNNADLRSGDKRTSK